MKIFSKRISGIAYATVIEAGEGSAVTITCPLKVQYPTWTGPEGLANPINNGQTINEAGITWINDKDLKINKTMLKHDGNYTCIDDDNNSRTVQVDVQCMYTVYSVYYDIGYNVVSFNITNIF